MATEWPVARASGKQTRYYTGTATHLVHQGMEAQRAKEAQPLEWLVIKLQVSAP